MLKQFFSGELQLGLAQATIAALAAMVVVLLARGRKIHLESETLVAMVRGLVQIIAVGSILVLLLRGPRWSRSTGSRSTATALTHRAAPRSATCWSTPTRSWPRCGWRCGRAGRAASTCSRPATRRTSSGRSRCCCAVSTAPGSSSTTTTCVRNCSSPASAVRRACRTRVCASSIEEAYDELGNLVAPTIWYLQWMFDDRTDSETDR